MYGDEEINKTPSSLFNRKNAEEALKNAQFCLECVENLFEAFLKKRK